MTSSITFCNPGEIDIRLITTLGVNVKDCDSPIGYFGTGLKYAIAVALREAQEIVVWSGLQRIDFRVVPGEIRGKEFGFIECQQEGAPHAHRMGFTTDLGKNWTLANAYRELYSNSLDESGREGTSDDIAPQEGYTTIIVTGDAFAAVHRARYDFLLDPLRTKFASNGHVEVYAGECKHIFYRGIAACKLAKPAAFLYNILDTCELTEDRTLSGGSYLCDYKIGSFLATAAPRHVMERAFTNKDGYEEHCEFAFVSPSDECLDVLGDLVERDFERVLDKPKSMYYRKRPKPRQRVAVTLSAWQSQQLASAERWLASIGFALDFYPIVVCESLGDRVLACAEAGKIYLTPECFEQGDLLRLALLEEFVHLRSKVLDCTRQMQNVLFAEIIRLGVELRKARGAGL